MELFFASGDAPFFWKETINALGWLPRVFDASQGFGISRLAILWIAYPVELVVKFFSSIGISWFVTEKVLWMAAFIISFLAMFRLSHYFFHRKLLAILSAGIYTVNTYSLLLFGGGQIGVLLAYGFLPIVFLKSIEVIDDVMKRSKFLLNLRTLSLQSLYFGVLGMFDIRVFLMAVGMLTLYVCAVCIRRYSIYQFVQLLLRSVIFPTLMSIPLHAYWLIPFLKFQKVFPALNTELTDVGMLRFLSFTDFSHALTLLHPNWPENLFGKVYFLQPEFLILPIVAFASLFFRSKKTIFFSVLALMGIFLAKGVNEPFGIIYQWMFDYIPGFILFRDSTKFYILIALSYAILIPFSIQQISDWMTGKLSTINKNNTKRSFMMYLLIFIFLVFWCVTLRPLFLRQMSGNFKPIVVPSDYVRFKEMLVMDTSFGRTLWLPRKENISYASDLHPILTSMDLWNQSSPSGIVHILSEPSIGQTFDRKNITYIVVPTDIEKRIFLNDYAFNSRERKVIVDALASIGWGKVGGFDELLVYRNPSSYDQSKVPVIASVYDSGLGVVVSFVYAMSLIIFGKKYSGHRA